MTHIEPLCFVSLYFVIFNHTQYAGFLYFAHHTESPLYCFYMFVLILCKIAVSIFFMITGTLLLEKEKFLRMVFGKRVLQFAVILLVVLLVYYFVLYDGLSAGDFIRRVDSSNMTMGDLYSYLAILLMFSFLRKLELVLSAKGRTSCICFLSYSASGCAPNCRVLDRERGSCPSMRTFCRDFCG